MQATTPTEQKRRLSDNVKTSKIVWGVPIAIMFLIIFISKTFRVQVPFIHLDIGSATIGVMLVACIAAIAYYSSVGATTKRTNYI